MNTSTLVSFLKNEGVNNNNVIRKIVAAAEAAESERLDSLRAFANREGMTQLPSPMAAAASDPKIAGIVHQTAGMIRNATMARRQGAYHLPLDHPVNVLELRAALREAKVDASTSGAIVENLYACGLVPA
jgi:hypothetical protein